MSTKGQFAICVRNEGYAPPLEFWKVYRILPSPDAAKHHCVRVVDEARQDYLYPKDCFVPVELPRTVRQAMLGGSWHAAKERISYCGIACYRSAHGT